MATLETPPYERFQAWQACYTLAVEVYRISAGWPKYEIYGLTSQVRRAAYSAGANISEGSAKRGPREFGRFVDISLGSLAELAFALRLARDVGVLHTDDWERIEELRQQAGRLAGGLCRALRAASGPSRSARAPNGPANY